MRPRQAWRALTRRDLIVSALPWRAMAYLLSGIGVGIVVLVLFLASLAVGAALTLVLIGIALVPAIALGGAPVAALERLRLRLVDGERIRSPHRKPERPGLRAWVEWRFKEPATWRELGYTALLIAVLWPAEALVVVYCLVLPLMMIYTPFGFSEIGEINLLKLWLVDSLPEALLVGVLGVLALTLAVYPLTAVAFGHAMLARLLLAPRGDEQGERLAELTRSRTRLLAAFESERRRIERDLHDGAQQRLVSLTMTLGLARMIRGEEAAELVAQAHEQAKLALAEIRDLIRGIHPRILADRGLPAAVADVADRSPVPVEGSIDCPRLPEAIESVAYFVVCEALANVAKHSGAASVSIDGRIEDGRLVVEVRDDGVGGADAGAGTGLAGLADRVSVVDGRLMLSSPAGGPTLLRVEIPCTTVAA